MVFHTTLKLNLTKYNYLVKPLLPVELLLYIRRLNSVPYREVNNPEDDKKSSYINQRSSP